jgi:pyruvate kinase
MMTKTTIVATLGPATASEAMIKTLIDRRVTVFRLNFSHGTFESHQATLDTIRRVSQTVSWAVCVMGDLCGPKIRAAKIEPAGELHIGDTVVLRADSDPGDSHCFGITTPELVKDVCVGQRILIDDGTIRLLVVKKEPSRLTCTVQVGGAISTGKGVNLPDTKLSLPAITERDWAYVEWAIQNDLDYLALSFVQTADEIFTLKKKLTEKHSPIRVVAKIEKPLAVTNLESILHAADALLVARGDLGVEMDLAQVPLAQKKMTALCRRFGKPVIVATQVLQSMIHNPVPTRAEASDVANAVMDYADAIMLSGETAVGDWPTQAVEYLAHACRITERYLDQTEMTRLPIEILPELHEREALTRSVAMMLDRIKVKLVVAWTESGMTARLLSKARPDVPVLALCPDARTARQLAFYYGVLSIYTPRSDDFAMWLRRVENLCLDNGWAQKGDNLILLPPEELLSAQNRWSVIMHTIAV